MNLTKDLPFALGAFQRRGRVLGPRHDHAPDSALQPVFGRELDARAGLAAGEALRARLHVLFGNVGARPQRRPGDAHAAGQTGQVGPPVVLGGREVLVGDVGGNGEGVVAEAAGGDGQPQAAPPARVDRELGLEQQREHKEHDAKCEGREDDGDGGAGCVSPSGKPLTR